MDCTVTPLKTLMGFSVHLNVQLKFCNLPFIFASFKRIYHRHGITLKILPPCLMHGWLGGILAITGITTAFAVMGQLVSDRSNNVTWDFRMTAMSPLRISLSYFLSTALVSFIMQVVVFAITVMYFNLQDKLIVTANMLLSLLVVTIVNTAFATMFSLVIV